MNELDQALVKFYENYQGAEDLRTDAEKEKDFTQEEFVASAAPVNWVEKREQDWRVFPVLNQFFTFKCVAFTIAKQGLISFWLKTKEIIFFSPNSIYDYRSNKPGGGMVGNEAFEIWRDKGIALEAVCKSNQIQDTDPFEISLFAKEVAKGFKLSNYITISNGDFDRVASTIQETGKGIMVWFYFTYREWAQTFPRVMDNLSGPYVSTAIRHSVCNVDYGLINGKEYLRIEDSAHFGDKSIRYISREFFNARNFLTKYPMSFNYEDPATPTPSPKPHYIGTTVSLQDCLKHYGTFPTNVESTGVFGAITKKAVSDFQVREKLHATGTGTVGPLTTARLKLLYP